MNKFREGQIVIHKISKEEFVVIKYRCLFYKIICYGTYKNIILVSFGKSSSQQYDLYESELRCLTEKEVKKKE